MRETIEWQFDMNTGLREGDDEYMKWSSKGLVLANHQD